jgi:HD-GYP domain-containing protein (c-di-GMP phosphodiesterase class II)
MIGRRSGMREDRVTTLRYAGMLHDVGKLGVPTEVLQASGKLTDVQYEAIQLHPVRGREITKDLEFLGEAIEAIHLHHERIDGRGYPLGLKGSEIPEFARIIAVADAFDSMTTTRSYRGARSVEDAFDELRRCKGSQFDPVMVEALVEAVQVDGWELVDTSSPPEGASTSHAIDDDDPTVAGRLGIVIPMTVPRDASELDDDEAGGRA